MHFFTLPLSFLILHIFILLGLGNMIAAVNAAATPQSRALIQQKIQAQEDVLNAKIEGALDVFDENAQLEIDVLAAQMLSSRGDTAKLVAYEWDLQELKTEVMATLFSSEAKLNYDVGAFQKLKVRGVEDVAEESFEKRQSYGGGFIGFQLKGSAPSISVSPPLVAAAVLLSELAMTWLTTSALILGNLVAGPSLSFLPPLVAAATVPGGMTLPWAMTGALILGSLAAGVEAVIMPEEGEAPHTITERDMVVERQSYGGGFIGFQLSSAEKSSMQMKAEGLVLGFLVAWVIGLGLVSGRGWFVS